MTKLGSEFNVFIKKINRIIAGILTFLVIFNLLTAMCMTIVQRHSGDYLDAAFTQSPVAILVACLFTIIAFAFLYCGNEHNMSCSLNVGSFILGVLLVVEGAAAIKLYSSLGEMKQHLAWRMGNGTKKYLDLGTDTYVWDGIQRQFSCCGIHGLEDWKSIYLATSCCGYKDPPCMYPRDKDVVFSDGCLEVVNSASYSGAVVLITSSLFCAMFQALLILTSCSLRERIDEARRKQRGPLKVIM